MAVLSNGYFLLGNHIIGKKDKKCFFLNDEAYREVTLAIEKGNTTPLSLANEKFLRENGLISESDDINNPNPTETKNTIVFIIDLAFKYIYCPSFISYI